MTNSRPRPEPVNAGPRPRPSDERAQLAADGRSTRRLALAALGLSLLGVGIAVAPLLLPGDESCQDAAWTVEPATADLPTGWALSSSQYDINRQQVTFVGPPPEDETSSQAVVYTTVTCFPEGAEDALNRSEQAARDAGQSVILRDDLGDGGFAATDESGATFLQLRHAGLVVYLAASAEASATAVDQLASAYDRALGGDGGAVAVGTPDVGTSTPSEPVEPPSEEAPSDVAAAPELEARLPATVDDIALTVDSAAGTDILGEDSSSRAILAALRAAGKEGTDLSVAQAYDETQAADLSILAVTVDGLDAAAVEEIVLDSWLAASGAGVARETVTLGGRSFTQVDYGDDGTSDYVLAEDDAVIVITTASAELAEATADALP